MSAEENRVIVRRYAYASAFGDLSTMDELTAPNFVYHNPGTPKVRTHEEHKQMLIEFGKAFPDLKFNIEEMIAEGNKVAVRYSFSGTHKGEFAGIPPTNKQVEWTNILICHLTNGKVVEEWVENNSLAILLQIGVIPLPAGSFHIKE